MSKRHPLSGSLCQDGRISFSSPSHVFRQGQPMSGPRVWVMQAVWRKARMAWPFPDPAGSGAIFTRSLSENHLLLTLRVRIFEVYR
jgi:hypothetical protein